MRKSDRITAAAVAAVLAGLAWWVLGSGGGEAPAPDPAPSPPDRPVPGPPPPPPPPPASPAPAVKEPAPPAPGPAAPETPSRTLLLARAGGSRTPVPGARVWLCAFRVQGADGPLGAGEADPGHHPACVAGEPLGVTGEDGRVLLDLARDRFVHVGASGYAWAKISREADGSLEADLGPGGAVRLVVRRWGELEEPVLVAFPGDAEPEDVPGGTVSRSAGAVEAVPGEAASTLLAEGEVEEEIVEGERVLDGPTSGEEVLVEGLEAGTWTFLVERGAPGGEVYARGSVLLPPGGEAKLVLDAVPTTAGPRSPVTATVHVALGKWGESAYVSYVADFDVEVASPSFVADPGREAFLVLQGLDPRNAHLEGRGALPKAAGEDVWTVTAAPDLPPGRYRATVNPPGWSTEVEVAEGNRALTLRVPDPAETEVVLTDSLTGRPVPGRILWTPFGRGRHQWAEADAESGTLLLRAPPGTYRCSVTSPAHRNVERTLALAAGPRGRVGIALDPAASVRVLLRSGGAPHAGDAYVHAEMKLSEEEMKRLFEDPEAQESGIVTGQSGGVSKGEVVFDNLTPGPCEIRVDRIPGFAPVPPRTVTVHAGRVEEVVIELARE
ncbi:MAG: carboxypeptidase-like regulatory domain-containing protein [Planctomycetes bacterium]|nr:carboxypeptidase-like regulatory domain-containing protein [Planctomycetota bacterium]